MYTVSNWVDHAENYSVYQQKRTEQLLCIFLFVISCSNLNCQKMRFFLLCRGPIPPFSSPPAKKSFSQQPNDLLTREKSLLERRESNQTAIHCRRRLFFFLLFFPKPLFPNRTTENRRRRSLPIALEVEGRGEGRLFRLLLLFLAGGLDFQCILLHDWLKILTVYR